MRLRIVVRRRYRDAKEVFLVQQWHWYGWWYLTESWGPPGQSYLVWKEFTAISDIEPWVRKEFGTEFLIQEYCEVR